MSSLASRAEVMKLAQLLGSNASGGALDEGSAELTSLPLLAEVPSDVLRHVRLAIAERCARHERERLQRLARWARWLPVRLIAIFVRLRLSPLLTARLAALLPADLTARLAAYLPSELLAEVAIRLDVRAARELMSLLPLPRILNIADVLLQRRDYLTLGRFVTLVPDEVVQAVAAQVPDETDLLQIVFGVDVPGQVDHLVRLLPPERIERSLMLLADEAQKPHWPALLALVSHVGSNLQTELGERAAALGDGVLDAIVQTAHEQDLWEDLLPVVANLSPALQRRVVSLPSLQCLPILERAVRATQQLNLWADMLDVVEGMQPATRDLLSQVLVTLPDDAYAGILEGAMLRSRWNVVIDMLQRLPSRQDILLQLITRYQQDLDSRTRRYLDDQLAACGMTLGSSSMA